jgi:hypothetical protein
MREGRGGGERERMRGRKRDRFINIPDSLG